MLRDREVGSYMRLRSRLLAAVLLCSAGMSLVLSFFNLLPCLPLDGGRMVETVFGEKTAALCGLITASAVFVTGFALFTGGSGPALFFAGAILLVKNI